MKARLNRRYFILSLFTFVGLLLATTWKVSLARLRIVSRSMINNFLRKSAVDIDFSTATPASAGIDDVKLAQLITDLESKQTQSFLIFKSGSIVCEWYNSKQGMYKRHSIASAAKAIVGGFSLAIALNEKLTNTQELAATYIPQWANHTQKSKITIEQLARHSSGIENAEENGEYGSQLAGWKGRYWRNTENRWKVSVEEAPLIFDPGTSYTYSNPGTSALSYVMSKIFSTASRSNVKKELKDKLMKPLGIPSQAWSINYGGESYRAEGVNLYYIDGGASFTARALARLGEVMLNKGKWQGDVILSEAVIADVAFYQGVPSADTLSGFPAPGLLWHTNANKTFPSLPADAYLAAGASHQILCIVPSLDMVIVRMGEPLGLAPWDKDYWNDLEDVLFRPMMSALSSTSATL